ncbi:hypothetical protein BYT27DRAFT_7261972 [Phlegmacium glaucopus]|nr:hypothetical protein BYT27DRAFT_7261972 [Phlegmacium glaucopus]
MHYTWIRYQQGDSWMMERLHIVTIASTDIIFGLPWFQAHNPQEPPDWRKREQVTQILETPTLPKATIEEIEDEESPLNSTLLNWKTKTKPSNLTSTTVKLNWSPLLSTTSQTEWKESIISAAKSRGVMGYLDGTIPRPATPSPSTNPSDTPLPATPMVYWGSRKPSQDEWEQCNAYAQGLITLNVKNPIGHGVNLEGTAAVSWRLLTDIQDKVTNIGRLTAGNLLRSIHHTKGSDLDAHFCVLQKAWKKYNDQGGRMDDTEF